MPGPVRRDRASPTRLHRGHSYVRREHVTSRAGWCDLKVHGSQFPNRGCQVKSTDPGFRSCFNADKENINMTTLSYSVIEPALRSPVEEWQPHAKQSESTTEWWYVTGLVHDTAGNPYFLAWCPFHFSGEKRTPASAGLPRDQRVITAMSGFTDYRNNFHIADSPAAVVNEADTWDPGTNAVRFVAGDYSSEWSYNGDAMHLTVASPRLSYDLRLTVAEQVMYAKDKLGIKGFIQEGAPEDRSYYYSLPRVEIVGRSYEFPVEVEGSRHYTLEPFSKLDVYESPNNILFEGPSRLINDDTGEAVGLAVTESMDVRIMQNAPNGPHQH